MSNHEPKQSKPTSAKPESKAYAPMAGMEQIPYGEERLFESNARLPQIISLQRNIGNRAVQRLMQAYSPILIHRRQAHGTTGQRSPFIQRDLAVQIREGNKPDEIASVEMVGRPEGYWSDTMGDHTTAFIVHQESIRTRLKGQKIAKAIEIMKSIVEAAKNLPGNAFADNLEGEQKQKYTEALEHLNTVGMTLTNAAHLQEYIRAYLSFRELIPGSTIKTKLKTGYFGKGKGESGHAAVLVEYEQGADLSDNKLLKAINGLFDSTGVGMLAVETNPLQVKAMSPGMDTGLSSIDRAKRLWQQHVESIKASFPKSYNQVKTQLANTDIPNMIKAQVQRDVEQDTYQAGAELSKAELAKSEIALLSKAKKKKQYLDPSYTGTAQYRVAVDNLEQAVLSSEEWIERGKIQFELLKNIEEKTTVTFDANGFEKRYKVVKELLDKIKQQAQPNAMDLGEENEEDDTPEPQDTPETILANQIEQENSTQSTLATPEKPKSDIPKPKTNQPDPQWSDYSREQIEENQEMFENIAESIGEKRTEKVKGKDSKAKRQRSDEGQKQTLTIQLLLDEANKITEMRSGGRPPSPFAGTMGAHTTSWVVHLDHVRRYIVGYTVAIAMDRVSQDLAPDALTMYQTIGENKQITKDHQRLLLEAFQNLRDRREEALALKDKNRPLFLQQYIHELLTFINYIPNATLRKIDTTGHGEGTYRNVLKNYEQGIEPNLKTNQSLENALDEAIKGLFDSRYSGPMWQNHLRIIGRTYPRSYQKAGYS